MFVILSVICFVSLSNAQEIVEESKSNDPRLLFANYTSGLIGLFNVNQMFISAMNVVILISFLVGGIIYYLSSSSTTASALAKEDTSFRGFANSETQRRSLHILSMVNTAIQFYKQLNGDE
eukprot:TRINITY_DN6362_c0_g1_i1.p1 TRINITY_DN6362_c0_g1~~TRINITY_DN6362_c0_g1_i1.p1  ORF type:complete len:129 (-),score=17.41 TRINITY_DN6362_c0_g1_i1:96-458(-)